MVMLKTAMPDAWDFGEPVIQLVKASSRGLINEDRRAFTKRAGADFLSCLPEIRDSIHPDEALIHLLAVGASEVTGQNRNGDIFGKKACQRYHHTFEKFAKFYRNHQNRAPHPSFGRIVKSAYNDRMGRIELLVALNATKSAADRNKGLVADRELEKLANGKEIPVSMSCTLDPNLPVLTSTGYKPIAEIRRGDLVHTHTGNWRPVTEIMKRQYSGEVVSLKVRGIPLEFQLTADHPLYAKVLASYPAMVKLQRPTAQWAKEVAAGSPAFAWTHAGCLAKDDRVEYHPVRSAPGCPSFTDIRLAELMGIYIAEGSLQFCRDNLTTVVLTVGAEDWAVRAVPLLVNSLWPDVNCNLRPKANSKVAFSLEIFSAELARWMRALCGQGCRTKRLPMGIYNSSREMKLALLGRWLDGDGWCDGKGAHWSTTNFVLALQARDLLVSLGALVSINKIDHTRCATSGMPGTNFNGPEYVVNVANRDASILRDYSEKVGNSQYLQTKRGAGPSSLYRIADTFGYKVSEVKKSVVENATVWNIEVEEDHSYSMAGLTSHNCKIPEDFCSYCHHASPTLEDYCTGIDVGGLCKAGGLRDNIGAMLEIDGGIHHLGADNREPIFFDISHVPRGAERVAFVTGMLQKAAAAGRTIKSAELARQLGITVPYEILVDSNQPAPVQRLLKTAYMLADLETDAAAGRAALPSNYCLGLPREAPADYPRHFREKFAHGLRALADAGCCLPLDAFLEVVCKQSREKAAELAGVVARELPGVYNRLLATDLSARLQSCVYVAADTAPTDMRLWATKQAAAMSLQPERVRQRATLSAMHGDSVGKWRSQLPLEKRASVSAPVTKLAEEYALYKLAFLNDLPDDAQTRSVAAPLLVMQNYAQLQENKNSD